MAEEIIKVLDYIMGNPAVQAFGIAYRRWAFISCAI